VLGGDKTGLDGQGSKSLGFGSTAQQRDAYDQRYRMEPAFEKSASI